jgi:hypothetical protein
VRFTDAFIASGSVVNLSIHFVLTNSSLHFLVLEHVTDACKTPSCLRIGYIHFSDPFLVPFTFQIPVLNHGNPILSLLVQQIVYDPLSCSNVSRRSPFAGVRFLKTPTNGKTAMREVKALWEKWD